jgi:pimeloyl-ACP methyl ester carboxylesterase
LRHLAGGPCLAVGASFGARVLLDAMARAPGLFRRAVLLAPYLHRGLIARGFGARLLARFPRQVRALYRPPLSVGTGVWTVVSSLIAGGASLGLARQAFPLIADVTRTRPETLDLIDGLPDGRALLRDVRVPVDVWYGDGDRVMDTPEFAALAELPGLNVVRVDGAGHALHDSHAAQLAAALLSAEPA